MVMTDDIVFPAATNEDNAVVPEGRWTLELLRIEDADPSTFRPEDGRRFKWHFALYDAAGARFFFNNEPYTFYRFTSKKNSPRATARKFAEALIGRKFEDGYVPKLSEMIGRRMSGVVTYEDNEFNPGTQVLKLSSLKPVASAAPAVSAQAAPPLMGGYDQDGNVAGDTAGLIEQVKKAMRKAEVLQTPKHLDWLALDGELAHSTQADLTMLLQGINNDIAAA